MDTSKIIRGVVSNGRYTVTAPIVKEDYGLYLKIEGVELPSTYEVDFSNSENSGSSVTMIGNADGVLIPHQFIDTGKDVFAFLYHVGQDFGRTVYKFRIPNKVRPDRTNEEPTPEEQSTIDQVIANLNDAVDRAEDAEQAIEDMSVSAQTLAEGSAATVTKTTQDGVVNLAFGIPKGEKGDTGGMSETAIDLLEQAGNYIPFTNGGIDAWEDLIAELRGVPIVYHSVTFSGEHYTANNDATTIRNGRAYECIITPSEGYEITALTVTMGETSIIPTESGGAYTISITSVTDAISISITAEEIPEDLIDICLFGGQSNMDGRGTAEDATAVTTGLAYKWDNTNNRTVAFEAEGSLIPAYMQEYTSQTGVPLVEVKEAIGGTGIAQYISDYLPLATTMLTRCKAYLEGQGKTVRRCFMLWCQGESDVDGDLSTGTTAYENYFATLKSTVMQAGVNQIFIINIGQASNGTFDFAPIRTALQEVCNGTDVIMVSDKFYNATSQMKDRWHYNQTEYNIVGKDSAKNTIAFFNGQTIDIKHFDSSDIYGVPTEYGTLDDWTYTLVNEKVRLDAYNGSNPNVRVYHQYLLDGYFYEARIASSPTSSVKACFTANTVIESVSVDNGVRMMNPNGNSDADNAQSLGLLFKNCTNLKSFSVGAEFPTPTDCEQMCKGATNFETFNFEPKGSLNLAFTGTKVASVGNLSGIKGMSNAFSNNTALTSVGDIDGTYTMAVSAFEGDSALESIGKIGSTALANINIMFNGCTSLAGVVRFESASISSATNAFNNCDLSKITIEVPANSTTYDTILAAYPSANIVTF